MDPLWCSFCYLATSSLDTLQRHRKLHKLKYARLSTKTRGSQLHTRSLIRSRRPQQHGEALTRSKGQRRALNRTRRSQERLQLGRNHRLHQNRILQNLGIDDNLDISGPYFECQICGECFPGQKQLSEHVTRNHQNKHDEFESKVMVTGKKEVDQWTCEAFLKVHEVFTELGIKFYRCCDCLKQFLSETGLFGHECAKALDSSSSRRVHIVGGYLQCVFCPIMCAREEALLEHLHRCHSKKWTRTRDSAQFTGFSLSYRCLTCKQQFPLESLFEEHQCNPTGTGNNCKKSSAKLSMSRPGISGSSLIGSLRGISSGSLSGSLPGLPRSSLGGSVPVKSSSSLSGCLPVKSNSSLSGSIPGVSSSSLSGSVPVKSSNSLSGCLPVKSNSSHSGSLRRISSSSQSGSIPGVSSSSLSASLRGISSSSLSGSLPGVSSSSLSGSLRGKSSYSLSDRLPRVSSSSLSGSLPGLSSRSPSGKLPSKSGNSLNGSLPVKSSSSLSSLTGISSSSPSRRLSMKSCNSPSGSLPRVSSSALPKCSLTKVANSSPSGGQPLVPQTGASNIRMLRSDRSYKTRRSLLVRPGTQQDKISDFKCGHCQKAFAQLDALNDHIRSHASRTSDQTAITTRNRGRSLKASLSGDVTADYKYKCGHCPIAFAHLDALNDHLISHASTGTKPEFSVDQLSVDRASDQTEEKFIKKKYQCGYCPRTFGDGEMDSLNDHLRSHASTGTKSKSSIDQPLDDHTLDQTKEKFGSHQNSVSTLTDENKLGTLRYKCGHCEEAHGNVGALKVHIRSHVSNLNNSNESNPAAEPQILIPQKPIAHCQTCQECFYTAEQRDQHGKETSHPMHNCHTCETCFDTAEQRDQHEDETGHSANVIMFCQRPTCKRWFYTLDEIKQHERETTHSWYQCKLCMKTLKNVHAVMAHRATHFTKKYRCEACKMSLATDEDLKAHMKIHEDNKHLQCQTCWKCFSEPRFLEHHVKTCQCQICFQCVRNQLVLCAHMKQEHADEEGLPQEAPPKETFKCGHCEKCYESKSARNHHMKIVHINPPNYKCDLCTEVFDQKIKFDCHMNLHSEMYKCGVCQKVYAYRAAYWTHHMKCHHSQVQQHKCEKCQKCFTTHSRLKQHEQAHTLPSGELNCVKLNPHADSTTSHAQSEDAVASTSQSNSADATYGYKCAICLKVLKSRGSFNSHLLTTHSKPGKEKLQCEFCGKCYPYPSALRSHIKLRHRRRDKCQCHYCGKLFTLKSTLTEHIRIHTNERPYQCKFCNKRFKHYSHKVAHTRIHTKEKPYACKLCGRRFNRSQTCNTHMRLVHFKQGHVEKKDFVGKYWTKVDASAVDEQNSHTKEKPKPYACKLCGRRFNRSQTCNTHMRLVHFKQGHVEEKDFVGNYWIKVDESAMDEK